MKKKWNLFVSLIDLMVMKTLLTARLPVTGKRANVAVDIRKEIFARTHSYPQADFCSAPYSDHDGTHLIIVCGAPRPTAWWGKKSVNTPFRRPSCQAREEKRKFSPTATSLRRRRQRSRTWATAQRALAEERKWRPKVHQARRDDRFSSRFLSLLLTAAIVPTRPTPLLLCSPLPLSLSSTRFDAFKDVIVWIVHNMLPILSEQPRHLGYRPVYVGFPYDL